MTTDPRTQQTSWARRFVDRTRRSGALPPTPLNVLVVDDSAVVRTMIVRTLKLTELPIGQVHQASNGRDGLDLLEKHWVDLVLVDINMPVMNGEEMIDRIREQEVYRDLPLVVVSTEGSKTRIDRLINKGVRFVHKPFMPETIREVILEVVESNHEQRT